MLEQQIRKLKNVRAGVRHNLEMEKIGRGPPGSGSEAVALLDSAVLWLASDETTRLLGAIHGYACGALVSSESDEEEEE